MGSHGQPKKRMAKSKSNSVSRNVAEENNYVETGVTEAKRSMKALFFHDIPPELLRRIATRYTVGHKKYGVKHVNLNWRIGINDAEFVADAINHLCTHLVNFLEDGDEQDDNLGAIVWGCGFLMEVERLAPEVLKSVLCQSKLFGESAKQMKDELVKG